MDRFQQWLSALMYLFGSGLYMVALSSLISWAKHEMPKNQKSWWQPLVVTGIGTGFIVIMLLEDQLQLTTSDLWSTMRYTVVFVAAYYLVLENTTPLQYVLSAAFMGISLAKLVPRFWPLIWLAQLILLLLVYRRANAVLRNFRRYTRFVLALCTPVLIGQLAAGVAWPLLIWALAQVAILANVIRGYSEILYLQTQRVKKIQKQVIFDELTALRNFRAFNTDLAQAFKRFQTDGTAYAIYTLDIDHFKRVNDTYGHLVGNEVLAKVAAELEQTVANVSFVSAAYRTGGEEFTFLLHNIKDDRQTAITISQTVQKNIAALEFSAKGQTFKVTVSVGEDRVLPDDSNYLAAFRRADQYLYASKRNGRNAITVRGQTISNRSKK